ncbi:hypothetical protein GCM10023206_02380 [Acinetobacter puyangensis]|uniref:EpsG family protein n=1 Tax=Acinetobacter puyangensis TaxID=1096779 RepID=A0A240E7C0_9GAMM|nr:hypothetical protein [Acinetobacter puyangensis]SNX44411.1 hypothetical protein SAMN05421731_103149 [Acinetobacter puyangensis]
MIIKYRTIYLTLILSFFIGVCILGEFVFSSTMGKDALLIANMEVEDIQLGSSYGMMAWLYQMIPSSLILVVTIFIGSMFILNVFKDANKNYNLLLLLFLCSVPCVLTISSFQKDLILVLFIIPVTMLILSNINNFAKLILISAIYISYAVVFRSYYYLITILFVGIYFFKVSNGHIRLSIILASICVFLLIPNTVYYSLQSSRDLVNLHRVGVNGEGYRTAFLNPLSPDSFFNFLYNYVYAILRLNFGFFFNSSIKDLVFMIYPLIYYYYVFKGLISQQVDKNFFAASLVLSHALVYFLFEPDTGSYARHLSSTLPYLAIVIASGFNMQKKYNFD